MNRLNQKGLRPQDKPIALTELSSGERAIIWNEQMQRVAEPGEFELMVGSSTEDIRLSGIVTIGNRADE